MTSPRRAVFLDRDGTLNADFGFVRDAGRVEIIAGAREGAKALVDAGFVLVVASNQSGIARGLLTAAQADAVDERIKDAFATAGAPLTAFYRCPHLPDAVLPEFASDCDCRKPKPGMLTRAAKELNIDLSRSWVVGDRARDIAAGLAAGCRAVAVEPVPRALSHPQEFGTSAPEYYARDLKDAARFIIEHS